MGTIVKDEFSIDVSWLPGSDSSPAVRETAAALRVSIGDEVVTRVNDLWSRSVQDQVRVSAYPLAMWVASSWWRLRWEAQPLNREPDLSWRMSHEVPGAGHGFLWPSLTFASDGEQINARCHRSNPLSDEQVLYLSDLNQSISGLRFEKELDSFVELVLARLNAMTVERTELHALWDEVKKERIDPVTARHREWEARLGFDPDEGPPSLLQRMAELVGQTGRSAMSEIAPVCAGVDPLASFERIEQFAQLPGVIAEMSIPNLVGTPEACRLEPWKMGWSLARRFREAIGLKDGPLSDQTLADVLGMKVEKLQKSGDDGRPLIGLAVRSRNGTDAMKLLFRRRNRPGIRFEGARFLGDHASTGSAESWLPVTDSRTHRQKLQRAFAAEFLSPIESLKDFMRDGFSAEAVEEAGEHFGVSERAVESHLANHRLIPFDWVSA